MGVFDNPGAQAGLTGLGMLGGPWGMAISTLAPMLLGMMGSHNDPAKRRYNQIRDIMSPWAIEKEGQDLFQNTLNSPGYNMARSDLLGAGNSAMGAVQRQLGQSGLTNSGVGLAAIGSAGAAPGRAQSQLTASAWDQAMQNAQGRAGQRAAALGGMPQEQNWVGNMSATSLNSLLPILMNMLNRRGGGSNGGWGGGSNGPGNAGQGPFNGPHRTYPQMPNY